MRARGECASPALTLSTPGFDLRPLCPGIGELEVAILLLAFVDQRKPVLGPTITNGDAAIRIGTFVEESEKLLACVLPNGVFQRA